MTNTSGARPTSCCSKKARRPRARSLVETLGRSGERLQVSEVRTDGRGLIESLTVRSPDDYSAMDITYVSGDEVTDQAVELAQELTASGEAGAKKALLTRLSRCSARLDIYHFEQTVGLGPEGEDEADLMDPGGPVDNPGTSGSALRWRGH